MADPQPPPYSEETKTSGSSSNNIQLPHSTSSSNYTQTMSAGPLPHSSRDHLAKDRSKYFDKYRNELSKWKSSVETWSLYNDVEQLKDLKKVSEGLPEIEKVESYSGNECHTLALLTAISTILMHQTGRCRFSASQCASAADTLPHQLYDLCHAYDMYKTVNDAEGGLEQSCNMIIGKESYYDDRRSACELAKAENAMICLTETLDTGVLPENLTDLDRTFIQAVPFFLRKRVPTYSYNFNRPDPNKVREEIRPILRLADKWDEAYTKLFAVPVSTSVTTGKVPETTGPSANNPQVDSDANHNPHCCNR